MRLRSFALLVTALSILAPAASHAATAPYTLIGVFPGNDVPEVPPLVHDLEQLDPMTDWQGKRNAIVNVFAGDTTTASTYINSVWNNYHSVPMLSYQPPGTNAMRASGLLDQTDTMILIGVIKDFIIGGDNVANTSDDRRIYLRYMWEPNHQSRAHSPCNPLGGTAADYVAAWRHAHDLFVQNGLSDPRRIQWVYSVAAGDSPSCPSQGNMIENTYPGSSYVDWTGVDMYGDCDEAVTASGAIGRLRAVAPNKPLGVNEVGISSAIGNARKNIRIDEYFNYVANNDIRMSVWFNWDAATAKTWTCESDPGNRPWAIFGSRYGDSPYSSRYIGYSKYRQRVGLSSIVGSSFPSNPQLITDAQFRGL